MPWGHTGLRNKNLALSELEANVIPSLGLGVFILALTQILAAF